MAIPSKFHGILTPTVPLENIVGQGHIFYSKKYDKDGIKAHVFVDEDGQVKSCSLVDYRRCWRCGEHLRCDYDTKTNMLHITNDVCEAHDELETVVHINVPSGRMIVDDSLREVYDAEMDGLDYNSALGQSKFVKRMEQTGCAYGPVGNTCPSVYSLPDGTYAIASTSWDDETDEEIVPPGWQEIAGVCTDLWAYSIADYQDFLARGGKPIEEDDQHGTRSVIDVEPGVYAFTLYTGRSDFREFREDNKPTIFADFKRVSSEAGTQLTFRINQR